MDERKTALYCRLSRNDGSESESESISNQKEMLKNFAKEKGFLNPEYYIDDGISGTLFEERPALQQLLEDCREDRISVVITKDLSRLGRDYLETGNLIERFFPQYNVRYIAVMEKVDTDCKNEDYYIMPLRNWMNEFYARETSTKIRNVMKQKAKKGERMSHAPYGYILDPKDKNHLIIDKKTEDVVKKIFEMYVNGKSIAEIRVWLKTNQILTPQELVKLRKDPLYLINPEISFKWYNQTINVILSRVEYLGHTVRMKQSKYLVEDENPYIFYNTHEPIIDKETFEKAQERQKMRIRPLKTEIVDPLAGLFFCADCGNRMYCKKGTKTDERHHAYVCGTYKNSKSKCTGHAIFSNLLMDILKADIKNVIEYVTKNREEFSEMVEKAGETSLKKAIEEKNYQLDKVKQRNEKIEDFLRRAWEQYNEGNLAKEAYKAIEESYKKESKQLNEEISLLDFEILELKDTKNRLKSFFNAVDNYDQTEELQYAKLRELVEKIQVHAVTPKPKMVYIDIFYKHIGQIDYNADKPELFTSSPRHGKIIYKVSNRKKRVYPHIDQEVDFTEIII